MEHEKVLRLQKDWENRKCEHPVIENELHFGKETGNKVCSTCGKVICETVWKMQHHKT